jgi:hypothetical protein
MGTPSVLSFDPSPPIRKHHEDNVRVDSNCTLRNGRHSDNGITYPSVQGQADVIATAHRLSGLDPNCTPYIECHGTGTPIGDPIEVRAISKALRRGCQAQDPVLIGSVSTHRDQVSDINT